MSTPEAGIDVGGTCVTASDVTEVIAWLEANMGTRFTFTQGMKVPPASACWPGWGRGAQGGDLGGEAELVSSWPVPITTRLAHPYCRTL